MSRDGRCSMQFQRTTSKFTRRRLKFLCPLDTKDPETSPPLTDHDALAACPGREHGADAGGSAGDSGGVAKHEDQLLDVLLAELPVPAHGLRRQTHTLGPWGGIW